MLGLISLENLYVEFGLIGFFFILRSSRTFGYSCKLASSWSVISRWSPGRCNYKVKVNGLSKGAVVRRLSIIIVLVLNRTVNADSG